MNGSADLMAFVKDSLEKAKKPFERFVIVFEGYVTSKKYNRVDAIFVHGFDVTQLKGVALAQLFNPKEKGGFRKIDNKIFLGNPDLIIEQKANPNADYSVEEIKGDIIASEKGGLISYLAVFVYNNPSIISRSVIEFLRSRISNDKNGKLSGTFVLNIDGDITVQFLTYLITNAINEELQSDYILRWIAINERDIEIKCRYAGKIIYETIKPTSDRLSKNLVDKYQKLNIIELENEYLKILSIPDAHNNRRAIHMMIALMNEYKNRGIEMPSNEKIIKEQNKKWWQFW